MLGDVFKCAIETCDTDTLNWFVKYDGSNSSNQTGNYSFFEAHIHGITSQPIGSIIKLLNFFETMNYDCFTEKSFMNLIESLRSNTSTGKVWMKLINYHYHYHLINLKLNVEEFILLIKLDVPKKMQLILNNSSPISMIEFTNHWFNSMTI